MAPLTQNPLQGDILKYEANANYSREQVTLLTGTNYVAGSVLGKITASGKYTLSPASGATGEETAIAVLLYDVDASAADQVAVVLARGPAIVSKAGLVFDATVDQAAEITAKHDELVAVGIVPRDSA